MEPQRHKIRARDKRGRVLLFPRSSLNALQKSELYEVIDDAIEEGQGQEDNIGKYQRASQDGQTAKTSGSNSSEHSKKKRGKNTKEKKEVQGSLREQFNKASGKKGKKVKVV